MLDHGKVGAELRGLLQIDGRILGRGTVRAPVASSGV
jgi:hypothetical protein